nr:putative late blight resistance protein homolog R1B-16 [Ipomoea batatas]
MHLRCPEIGPPFVIPNIDPLDCLKNLMRLRFTYLAFEWKAINILGKLSKLEVLRLSCCKCIDEKWELLEEENFDQLIYLEIDSIYDLKQWEASDCHFPNLERLVLKRCTELVTIPTKIADNLNLKSIELDNYCLPSAMDSAKEIQKEQHEYGNENMVIIPLEHTTQQGGSSLTLSSHVRSAPIIRNVGQLLTTLNSAIGNALVLSCW